MRAELTVLAILSLSVVAFAGCLQPDEDPAGSETYAVTLCDAAGACASGETCRDGLCLLDCAASADCPAGAVCVEGSCWADSAGDCSADAECAPGETCVDGLCVAYAPVLECAEAADCPAGATCVEGECAFDPADPELCNGLDDDGDGLVDEGCEWSECASTADCDDGDPATIDACIDGVCVSDPAGCGAAGVLCAAGEVCLEGVCVPEGTCVAEVCGNGLDDDCDGLVDEGCGADADGDGFPMTEDCDDTDAAINPAAFEECNGLDDDCDGRVDEDCTSGSGACSADADCAAGEVCLDGACVAG